MPGTVILSHGLNSSPLASKVSAMAAVAVSLGWREQRPDFSDLDASGQFEDIDRRIERLCACIDQAAGPVVLAGSSMGAFASGLASLQRVVSGLFLLVPPIVIDGYPRRFDAAPVPTAVIHAWGDALIPPMDVVHWARQRRCRLSLVDDAHRLERHVDWCAAEFGRFLQTL